MAFDLAGDKFTTAVKETLLFISNVAKFASLITCDNTSCLLGICEDKTIIISLINVIIVNLRREIFAWIYFCESFF